MPDRDTPAERARQTPLGIYDKPSPAPITGIEIGAILLSAVWLGGALVLYLVSPDDQVDMFVSLRFAMTMLTVFMPVALIWVAAAAIRSNLMIRAESQRLQAAIDGLRQAYVTQAQRGAQASNAALPRRPEEPAAPDRKGEADAAGPSTRRAPPTAPAEPQADQRSLPLETPAEALAPPLERHDFIRALNFPETAEDEAGFDALRRALKDRRAAQLIQASQDVLTLLSQEGIYMDDLSPDMARPEVWRQFAQGLRGREIAALGGVHDRAVLAQTAGRMKRDPIFRDVAHHFLRLYDRMFADFETDATDADISALADTRTTRAFMLLGRVAGTFD